MRSLNAITTDDPPQGRVRSTSAASLAMAAGPGSVAEPLLPLVIDLDGGASSIGALRGFAGMPSPILELARLARSEGREVVVLTTFRSRFVEWVCRSRFWATDIVAVSGSGEFADLARLAAVRTRCPAGFVVSSGAGTRPAWARNAAVYVPAEGASTDAARSAARFAVLARALRLHQWVKNGLIVVPLVLAGRALDPAAWGQAVAGFLAFGLIASATYLVNDLHDLPHDRRHRTKRNRPLASGALGVPAAMGLAVAGLAGGLGLAASMGLGPFLVALTYVALTLAYTFAIKRIPVLDAVTLGGLFTLRLIAGITFCAVAYSSWLLVLSMLLFTSLALVKRLTEIQHQPPDARGPIPGRGYHAEDAPVVLAFGAATGTAAVLIFSLYIVEAAGQQPIYANPAFLWAAPVALFVWLGRIWLLCGRRALRDDPIEFAIRDRPSLALGLVVLASVVLAFLHL